MQVFVDDTARFTVGVGVQRHRRDMFTSEVAFRGPAARAGARDRVLFGDEADDFVRHELAQVQFAGRLEPVADHQVRLASGQAAPVVEAARERHQFKPYLRREALDPRYEFGQEQRVEVIACGDAEFQVAQVRLERALA